MGVIVSIIDVVIICSGICFLISLKNNIVVQSIFKLCHTAANSVVISVISNALRVTLIVYYEVAYIPASAYTAACCIWTTSSRRPFWNSGLPAAGPRNGFRWRKKRRKTLKSR